MFNVIFKILQGVGQGVCGGTRFSSRHCIMNKCKPFGVKVGSPDYEWEEVFVGRAAAYGCGDEGC